MGFDGLLLQDAHHPNHISGEVAQNQQSNVLEAQQRMLKSAENELGSYEPYYFNEDQQTLSTYFLPFEPYQENLEYHTIALNSSQGN